MININEYIFIIFALTTNISVISDLKNLVLSTRSALRIFLWKVYNFLDTYRIPNAFFLPNTKQQTILNQLESINEKQLQVAELCNLHNSQDLVLGDEQYIFTRFESFHQKIF